MSSSSPDTVDYATDMAKSLRENGWKAYKGHGPVNYANTVLLHLFHDTNAGDVAMNPEAFDHVVNDARYTLRVLKCEKANTELYIEQVLDAGGANSDWTRVFNIVIKSPVFA